MNATILTLTVYGNDEDVREVMHYTRSSAEMQRLDKSTARMIAADCSPNLIMERREDEFHAAHAAVVAYARRMAHARGCWTYNSSNPVNFLDVAAHAVMATADNIRQAIRTLHPSNA